MCSGMRTGFLSPIRAAFRKASGWIACWSHFRDREDPFLRMPSREPESWSALPEARGKANRNFVRLVVEENQAGRPIRLEDLLLLNQLWLERHMAVSEAALIIQKPIAEARRIHERLTESGIIDARGEGKNRSYQFSAHTYKKLGEEARICRAARLAAGSSRADGSPVCEGLREDNTQAGSRAMQDLLNTGTRSSRSAGEKRSSGNAWQQERCLLCGGVQKFGSIQIGFGEIQKNGILFCVE
jgi:hypothetical protein